MKKIIAVLMGLLSALTLFAGCAVNPGGELEYNFTETENEITYRFFSLNFQEFEGLENDRVLKHIEEKFNVKIEITGSSESAWEQRLTTEIADNNTPDLFFSIPGTSAYSRYIETQVITDLNPYIERANAANLQNMLQTEQYKTSTLIDGKNYFIPQATGVSNHTLYVRKDWMNLWNQSRGAAQDTIPTTLSEFTDMLRYFVEENLSGGRQTYGLSLCSNFDFYKDFMGTFGVVPDYYQDENGDFQISALSDNYKTMMDWFRTGVGEGYVYPDFYILTEDENRLNFLQGRCGAMISNGDAIVDGVLTQMRTLNPDNYMNMVELLPMPNSDDGQYKGGFKGWDWFWGGWSISADAEEPMRLIRILDYLFSEEGQKLLVYGVEGIHYTEENGEIVPNFSERLADGTQTFLYPDPMEPEEPAGRYKMGTQIIPVPFTIEDGKLVRNVPSETYFSAEMIDKSYDNVDSLASNPPNYSAVRVLISDGDMSDANTKILDAVETFTFNYISGKDYEDEKADMEAIFENNNLDALLQWFGENNV